MKLNKLIKRKANKQQIKGHIDVYGQGQLQGWAYDPDSPDDPVQLRVVVQGRPVAEGTADIFREDLLQSGFGNGKHGFRIRIPLSLNIGQAADVILLDADSGEKVAAKPFQVKRDNASSILIEELEGTQLVGSVTAGLASAERLLLTLFVDGTEVGGGVAVPKESSTFAFRIEIPAEWFDGMPHAITVVLNDEPGVEATWVDVLPVIGTPWEYLSSSAPRNGYAALSRVAGFRYESLRLKLDAAVEGGTYEAAALHNLMTAHAVVLEGYHGRRKFPKLALPYVENPTVSIVIPVHNKFELTYHCVASLILAQNDVSYEVVIVDDGTQLISSRTSRTRQSS
jgi:O-antigen biosynthesis protein